ncbi:MAG: SoxR reducing system RseC family protein [Alistipes sp.]|jgi:sigma-E factor negative regulatory protein RseC|nr:SoxR reducing system RseC family protein [Alistipes sp.]
MAKLLEHKGVVSEVGEKLVEVEFVTESACAGCKAKGLCGVDEGDKRFVTVYEPLAEHFVVGEQVMIGVSETMGMKAALWAYIIPFFILLGGLMITTRLRLGEATAGLTSLGVMCLYYVVLWFFRRRIEKEIVFKIRKI